LIWAFIDGRFLTFLSPENLFKCAHAKIQKVIA